MKTSVIISTYNGENYIFEQLNSIYKQSLKIDEVLIKDDCSCDNTVFLVEEFIRKNGLENNWKVSKNEENLGWKANFISGLKMLTGDIIFLCDQDDIWFEDKVEKMVKCFENKNIEVLVSDFIPFSEDNSNTHIFHPKLGGDILNRVECNVHFKEIRRPGCTYCIKRDLLRYIDNIWFEECPHDSFFWTISIVRDSLYSINLPLIHYRRHIGNNNPTNEKNSKRRMDILSFNIEFINRLLMNKETLNICDHNIKEIYKTLNFYKNRLLAISQKNVLRYILLLRYISYYPKVSSYFGDIISSLR